MRRAVTVFALTAIALAAATGCRGGTDAQEIVARAGAETEAAGSARVVVTTTLGGLPTGGDVTYAGEGVLDFDRRQGQLTVDLGPLMEGFGSGASGELDLVYDGAVAYLRAPLLSQAFPDLRPWIRIPPEAAAPGAEGFDQLRQLAGQDPTRLLTLLEGLIDGSVREVGSDEVRGQATTHYRARVDLRQAYEAALPDAEAGDIEALVDQLGDDDVDVDIWVDADGRARRVELDQPTPEGTLASTATTVLELYDFGVDVEVEVPDPSDTSDLGELAERIGR